MLASSIWISGKPFATSRACSRNRLSVARTTFALWTMVTFLRPNLRAKSKAARAMRSEPFLVLILHDTAYSFAGSAPNGANAFDSLPRVSASSAGTGLNSTPA